MRRPASEMIRLKAHDETVVVVNKKDRIPGRGCYLCPEDKCVEAALEKGRLSRALRRTIAMIPPREAILSGQDTKR